MDLSDEILQSESSTTAPGTGSALLKQPDSKKCLPVVDCIEDASLRMDSQTDHDNSRLPNGDLTAASSGTADLRHRSRSRGRLAASSDAAVVAAAAADEASATNGAAALVDNRLKPPADAAAVGPTRSRSQSRGGPTTVGGGGGSGDAEEAAQTTVTASVRSRSRSRSQVLQNLEVQCPAAASTINSAQSAGFFYNFSYLEFNYQCYELGSRSWSGIYTFNSDFRIQFPTCFYCGVYKIRYR
jgi:hypothetical protein